MIPRPLLQYEQIFNWLSLRNGDPVLRAKETARLALLVDNGFTAIWQREDITGYGYYPGGVWQRGGYQEDEAGNPLLPGLALTVEYLRSRGLQDKFTILLNLDDLLALSMRQIWWTGLPGRGGLVWDYTDTPIAPPWGTPVGEHSPIEAHPDCFTSWLKGEYVEEYARWAIDRMEHGTDTTVPKPWWTECETSTRDVRDHIDSGKAAVFAERARKIGGRVVELYPDCCIACGCDEKQWKWTNGATAECAFLDWILPAFKESGVQTFATVGYNSLLYTWPRWGVSPKNSPDILLINMAGTLGKAAYWIENQNPLSGLYVEARVAGVAGEKITFEIIRDRSDSAAVRVESGTNVAVHVGPTTTTADVREALKVSSLVYVYYRRPVDFAACSVIQPMARRHLVGARSFTPTKFNSYKAAGVVIAAYLNSEYYDSRDIDTGLSLINKGALAFLGYIDGVGCDHGPHSFESESEADWALERKANAIRKKYYGLVAAGLMVPQTHKDWKTLLESGRVMMTKEQIEKLL